MATHFNDEAMVFLGPDLPIKPSGNIHMVSVEDELYLIDTLLSDLLSLDCQSGIHSCEWIKLEVNLQDRRSDALVSLIPVHLTNCTHIDGDRNTARKL